jgi:DMSO/TMAO reductase YedYZ molybdopterin-dependent catalytic subunit
MTRDADTLLSDLANEHRRRLIAGGVGLVAAVSLGNFPRRAGAQMKLQGHGGKPLPKYADWKHGEHLIVHSPTTIETRRDVLSERLVTAQHDLYVRNNLPPPDPRIVAQPDAWEVAFEGVRNPRTVRVGDLKRLGAQQLTMVLQCSGNGRAFFPHDPSGTQWEVGAAGCVTWTGIPLKVVAQQLGGVAPDARFITSTGGEQIPANVDLSSVIVQRSVPMSALDDALLAWHLNGQPIPLAHGGPLRIVIPGYTGVNSVKYVKRVGFTPIESAARIQASRYRMVPLGGKGGPGYPSVWEMDVKSFITRPTAPHGGRVPAGSVLIEGVAFGGMQAAKGVEVSLDGGTTWTEAPLVGEDLGRYAWRQFVLPVRLQPGRYTLASRATDMRGNVQPEKRNENQSGYVNNSWRDHAVTIEVA